MNEFDVVTVIERPPAEVFAALTDVAKSPAWTSGLTEVRTAPPDSLSVGSTITYVGSFLGRGYESAAECTALDPGERFATVTTSGPFHLEVDYRLEPTGAGTTVTTRCRGESRGFFRLAEPVVIRLTRRQFESAGENLKALLEGSAL